MKNELYVKVIQRLKFWNLTCAAYGESGEVPHYLWSTLQHLPDESANRILNVEYNPGYSRLWDVSGAYNIKPFIFKYEGTSVMYIGKGAFMRYNKIAKCFTLSRYPDGYEEIRRNCVPFPDVQNYVCGVELKRLLTNMVLWYGYSEICSEYPLAMKGIVDRDKETYELLAEFVYDTVGFKMVSYDDFYERHFMVMGCRDSRKHLTILNDIVYNIFDGRGSVVRFSYNDDKLCIEQRSSSSLLSNHIILTMPEDNKPIIGLNRSKFMLACIPGVLALVGITLTWNGVKVESSTPVLDLLNVHNIVVNNFNSIVQGRN